MPGPLAVSLVSRAGAERAPEKKMTKLFRKLLQQLHDPLEVMLVCVVRTSVTIKVCQRVVRCGAQVGSTRPTPIMCRAVMLGAKK